jgi:hypothetical protein
VTLAVRSRKRATFDTLRLVVTITTFALILWWVGIAELATAFTNVVWFWVVMRLAPFTASMWVQAARWNTSLPSDLDVALFRTHFARLDGRRYFPGN